MHISRLLQISTTIHNRVIRILTRTLPNLCDYYSHCIQNWPVTQEMTNSFKFRRVGPARWWQDALQPLVRIAWVLPAFWPVQRSSVGVIKKFRPSRLPWWRLTSHTLIICLVYCPASRGFLPYLLYAVRILYCRDSPLFPHVSPTS